MILALLAAYLTKRPLWVQSAVLGLCTGLFVTTAAEANERDPLIETVVALVLTVGAVAGAAFYLAMRSQVRRGWTAGSATPTWVSLAYSVVWILCLLAAGRALFGAGGVQVALLALLPIVLLAPAALEAIWALLGRPPGPRAAGRR